MAGDGLDTVVFNETGVVGVIEIGGMEEDGARMEPEGELDGDGAELQPNKVTINMVLIPMMIHFLNMQHL